MFLHPRLLMGWSLLAPLQGLHMGAGQTPCQSFWQKLLGMIKAGTACIAQYPAASTSLPYSMSTEWGAI